ncbi:hypothetical protein DSM100238_0824 [Bifidobacterium apri]|uniref:Uncharacterized protein n=1 Tax=Bifidobacterium apri TaxID=1769423 RepID=A0A6A2VHP9_9BIFI|nr:hypothetical protein DSM100238_0824 [Bifidobacterium apri]
MIRTGTCSGNHHVAGVLAGRNARLTVTQAQAAGTGARQGPTRQDGCERILTQRPGTTNGGRIGWVTYAGACAIRQTPPSAAISDAIRHIARVRTYAIGNNTTGDDGIWQHPSAHACQDILNRLHRPYAQRSSAETGRYALTADGSSRRIRPEHPERDAPPRPARVCRQTLPPAPRRAEAGPPHASPKLPARPKPARHTAH